MTKWLASVQSVDEAKSLINVLPDILDMKDPSRGALGELDVSVVSEIVSLINGKCLTSATVGDLEMDVTVLGPAIEDMASSGVDYVKIGLFPDENIRQCLSDIASVIKPLETPVIAVLFADRPLGLEVQTLLAESGFRGVMVDTAIKNGKHLLDHMTLDKLSTFVNAAKQQNLLSGLAGALRQEDISVLSSLDADYLGFRSALCEQRERNGGLDLQRIKAVKASLDGYQK